MLYQAKVETLTPFSKEDKILIKNLYEYRPKGYDDFPDKGLTKNSINEVEKVRNSRHVNMQCDA